MFSAALSQPLPLPRRFEDILNRDHTISARAGRAMSSYLQWLSQSKIPFFPEYTDHGRDHVIRVLATCDELIAAKAWPLLTPRDVACLIAAVLLHDIAMHL